jgi:hypothetical protein
MNVSPLVPLAAAAASSLVSAAADLAGAVGSAFRDVLAEGPESTNSNIVTRPPLSQPLVLEDLASSAQQAIAEFQRRFVARLSEMGIALEQPLTLAVDAFGRIKAAHDHPQAGEIDALLASDDDLANLFRFAASRSELQRAAEEHQRFSELYAKNPELAVEQFSHLFDNRDDTPRFALQIFGDVAEPVYL